MVEYLSLQKNDFDINIPEGGAKVTVKCNYYFDHGERNLEKQGYIYGQLLQ